MANAHVEELMAQEETQKVVNQMYALLDSDEEAARIMESSDSPESLYEVISKYVQVKFEDFKKAFNETVEYFTEPKTELDDSMLDCVIGGGFCDWFKKNWKTVACVAVGVALAATGVGLIATAAVSAAAIGTTIATATAITTSVGAIVPTTVAAAGVAGMAASAAGGLACAAAGAGAIMGGVALSE